MSLACEENVVSYSERQQQQQVSPVSQKLLRYRKIEKVGEGTYGVVYKVSI